MFTVAPMITAPNHEREQACRSTACRISRRVMSVSET